MKKVIAFILAILPIFLIVVISIAGQIFAEYVYIPTEGVIVVDSSGKALPFNSMIRVGKGASAEVFYRVLPERATNKDTVLLSRNEDVAVVSGGMVFGVEYGVCELVVTTESGGFSASVGVMVTDEAVTEVRLGVSRGGVFEQVDGYSLSVGEQFTFRAEVLPHTAINKAVDFSSSNPSVAFIEGGTVTALSKGSTTITATSKDGGKFDSLTLNVVDEPPKFAALEKGVVSIEGKSVDLLNYIIYNTALVQAHSIEFVLVGGGKYASLLGSVLTVEETHRAITVLARTQINGVLHELELVLMRIV